MKTHLIDTRIFNQIYNQVLAGAVFHRPGENGKTEMNILPQYRKDILKLLETHKIEVTVI